MTILQKHLIFIPICFVTIAALLSYAVMLLWNWLMPDIFGLTEITYWQAVGLLVLCKILFGGLGNGGHHGHHGHHGMCHGDKNKIRERWEKATPEEREKMMHMHKLFSEEKKANDGE